MRCSKTLHKSYLDKAYRHLTLRDGLPSIMQPTAGSYMPTMVEVKELIGLCML